jgi:uncharacterized membrane protein
MLRRQDIIFGGVTLMLAAASFLIMRSVTINNAPKTVMETIEARIIKGAGGWNACYHNRVFGPRAGAARRANPDSIISSMAYDVSDGPVRVSGEVWPQYWSLSLYQRNSDNYFVVNDRQLPSPNFDFVIVRKGAEETDLTGTQIISPTDKGIMLIRRFAAQESDMPAIIDNQSALYCGVADAR